MADVCHIDHSDPSRGFTATPNESSLSYYFARINDTFVYHSPANDDCDMPNLVAHDDDDKDEDDDPQMPRLVYIEDEDKDAPYIEIPQDDHDDHTPITGVNLIQTVAQRERIYTARELEQAKLARELSKYTGYPSPAALIKLINSGSIINCPVTAHDVIRAADIYGPELGSLRGKTHQRSGMSYRPESLPRVVPAEQVLNVDLMFINGRVFLISRSAPLALTMVSDLGYRVGARAKGPVRKALLEQINSYHAHKFIPTIIHTDGEGAIASLTSELEGRGYQVNPEGPGQHVKEIERAIQEVKEHVCAVHSTLPYRLAATLLVWLVYFAVSRINMFPHKGGPSGVSPREAFYGVKLDYKRDLCTGFGEYLECTDPYDDNSMNPHTQACISLYPYGAIGSVRVLSLETGRVVTRNQFKSLPIPDNVIAHMNKLADTQANSPAAVLDFRMGSESTYFKLADIDAHSTESDDFLTNLVDIDEPRLVSADDAIHEQDEILIEERADSNVHISDFLIHDETTAHTTSTEMNTAYSEELSQPLNPVHTSPPTPDRRVHWATDVVTPPDNLLVAPPRTDRVLRSALRADTRIHWDSRTGGVKNATLYSTKQPLAFIEPSSLADRPASYITQALSTRPS